MERIDMMDRDCDDDHSEWRTYFPLLVKRLHASLRQQCQAEDPLLITETSVWLLGLLSAKSYLLDSLAWCTTQVGTSSGLPASSVLTCVRQGLPLWYFSRPLTRSTRFWRLMFLYLNGMSLCTFFSSHSAGILRASAAKQTLAMPSPVSRPPWLTNLVMASAYLAAQVLRKASSLLTSFSQAGLEAWLSRMRMVWRSGRTVCRWSMLGSFSARKTGRKRDCRQRELGLMNSDDGTTLSRLRKKAISTHLLIMHHHTALNPAPLPPPLPLENRYYITDDQEAVGGVLRGQEVHGEGVRGAGVERGGAARRHRDDLRAVHVEAAGGGEWGGGSAGPLRRVRARRDRPLPRVALPEAVLSSRDRRPCLRALLRAVALARAEFQVLLRRARPPQPLPPAALRLHLQLRGAQPPHRLVARPLRPLLQRVPALHGLLPQRTPHRRPAPQPLAGTLPRRRTRGRQGRNRPLSAVIVAAGLSFRTFDRKAVGANSMR